MKNPDFIRAISESDVIKRLTVTEEYRDGQLVAVYFDASRGQNKPVKIPLDQHEALRIGWAQKRWNLVKVAPMGFGDNKVAALASITYYYEKRS